jgi:hypothetical protein
VAENRIVGTVLELKTDEATGNRRKLHNYDAHNLYPSTDIIRR